MKAADLEGVTRRRRRGCTVRDPAADAAEDLVNRQFSVAEPNRVWVADITQQRAWDGWVYLAVVMDMFRRRIVGWSMARHLRTELVLDAVNMAIHQRRPDVGLVHHCDHGCQYTSLAFGRRLREAGLVGSMGFVGDCYDNAVAESFFATLETELFDRFTWPSRRGLEIAIFDYIEGFYNPRRRHSTLGQHSRATFEQLHQADGTPAA